jgi:hypothetical protein
VSNEPPNPLIWLADRIASLQEQAPAAARAQLAIELASLTILIDKGITTHEEAAQRIEQLHSVLRADPEHPAATALVQAAADFLRQHSPEATRKTSSWTPTVLEGGKPRRDDPDD